MISAQLWQLPPYEDYVQTPLTDELLDVTEQQLGVRLPESLITLLRVQNGGYLQAGFPEGRDYNTTHDIVRGIGTKFPCLEKGRGGTTTRISSPGRREPSGSFRSTGTDIGICASTTGVRRRTRQALEPTPPSS
ncbi:SMI1/KNR4 family protein [Mycolicibacterium sp. P1-18]|uniref:SMI1/KNR4 family protein n=1 Tax=Mycolicibacterium sp. P1-18 TaxID=2024615 RepID=UPI001F5B7F8A|nr:SMI1/KNR4 family protein [Mycolicibacterium sp. P1-18]